MFQCLNVVFKIQETFVVAFSVLMTKKEQGSMHLAATKSYSCKCIFFCFVGFYVKVFSDIKKRLDARGIVVKKFKSDYERAIMNSIRLVWIEAEVSGLYSLN